MIHVVKIEINTFKPNINCKLFLYNCYLRRKGIQTSSGQHRVVIGVFNSRYQNDQLLIYDRTIAFFCLLCKWRFSFFFFFFFFFFVCFVLWLVDQMQKLRLMVVSVQ